MLEGGDSLKRQFIQGYSLVASGESGTVSVVARGSLPDLPHLFYQVPLFIGQVLLEAGYFITSRPNQSKAIHTAEVLTQLHLQLYQ